MPNSTIPADREAEIQRIETGLIPAVAGDSRSAPPASITSRMDYYNVPGVSIAVINNYRLAWARGYGLMADGRSQPVDGDTLFQAASISKTIAALIVLRLIEAGRLDLDQDVNSYLKRWKVPANSGWQPRLTLRQLLSHTAGLTVSGFPGYYREHPLPTLLQILDGQEPANTPPVRVDTLPGIEF